MNIQARANRLLAAVGALAALAITPASALATSGPSMHHSMKHSCTHAMKHHAMKHCMKHHAMKHG